MIKKIILIVMDGVGIGELPDATKYNDQGSHTLKNIILNNEGLEIPNLISLGIGNIKGVNLPYYCKQPIGSFGKAKERSAGKDTITGHWEIAGIILEKPFPVYPNGFPQEVIDAFKSAIGREILWNKVASGTEIVNKFGEIHIKTGFPIIYTSADSVFQIAAHEDIINLDELYDMCIKARNILQGEHSVGRVIARPFIGKPGSFMRTHNRKDFSLAPINNTILDILSANSLDVIAVGKVNDIFSGQGISHSHHTLNNHEGVRTTLSLMKEDFTGLIFTNLVDFDMNFGHRNDIKGYATALEQFDQNVSYILEALAPDDVLIITSDHGCDPTTPGTDHTREYIPILIYGKSICKGKNIGIRKTFCDIGATILDFFDIIPHDIPGTSFKSFCRIDGW